MPRILTVRNVEPGGMTAYVARYWRKDLHGPVALEVLTGRMADGPVVRARVNHGRWIADCPTPHCANAMYVDPDDLRFFCTDCLNPLADGRWLPVELPEGRDEIEAALLARPVPATRNFEPGEDAADLRRQNDAEGL